MRLLDLAPMRKAIVAAGSVLLIAALASPSAQAKLGGKERPLKWSATGTSTLNLATGQNSIELTGYGTHMGLCRKVKGERRCKSFQQTEQAQVVPIGPGVLSFNSTWTVVIPNGDEMSGTCSGQSTTTDGVHVLVLLDCLSASGTGTGRFKGASASFKVTANVTRESIEGTTAHNTVEASGIGTISY